MVLIPFKGKKPSIHKTAYVAESAQLIGNVEIGENSSVWPNAVIRADMAHVKIGKNTSVQDCSVLHNAENIPVVVGDNVTIGHNAIVHGCTIHDNVLIGMGAIVMDNAIIHSNSIIAAGSVVLENTIVEEGSLYAGAPAKKIKTLDLSQTKEMIAKIATNYVMYAKWYKK